MAIATLSTLFECAPGTHFDDSHFGAGYTVLLRAGGLLVQTEPARRVWCEECIEPHLIEIERDAAGDYRGFCTEGAGWVEVDADMLPRFCFDQAAFLGALASALRLDRKVASVVDGICWELGRARDDGIVAFVVRGLDQADGLAAVAAALARFRDWRGVLICASCPPQLEKLLPRRLHVRTFDELIRFDPRGGFYCDEFELADGLSAKSHGRGAHGAPRRHPKLKPLIEARFLAGVGEETAAGEARWLLAHRDWVRQGKPLPAQKSLATLVSRTWKRLGATDS